MSEFKVGDEVEINKEKLSLKSLGGRKYCGITEEVYNRTYPQNIGVIIEGPDYDDDYLVKGVSSSYRIPVSCLKLKKKEYVALKDMSIEAFCEAADNRDEWFCSGITYLIEHEVCEDTEQMWVEHLDDFNREHPRFWQWLIDEGFIGDHAELKPCPLCGKDVEVYTGTDWYCDSSVGGFNVGCSAKLGGCGCSVGSYAKEHVINKWNQRV